MNSKEVLLAINLIAETSSKKEKEELVRKYAQESELFVQVMKLAYNPFYVYGILPTKADEAVEAGALYFDELDTELLLQDLRERKITGNEAREAVRKQLSQLDEHSAELLVRILRKDLRAGFSESTINKAVKGLIPVFPYMRCSLAKDAKIETWNWPKGILSQEKADGMFTNATLLESGLLLSSRQGTPMPVEKFKGIKQTLEAQFKRHFQYHGELLVERDGQILAREIGNGILNSVLKGGDFEETDQPIFIVWDLIPINEVKSKGQYEVPYAQRLKEISTYAKAASQSFVRVIPTRVVKDMQSAVNHFLELVAQGKEGTVIKTPLMKWKDGTSKEQVKMKIEADCELKVMAVNEGKIGSKNEGRPGALHCHSECGKLIVDVAVKNEKMRDEVQANPEDWIGKVITVRGNQVLKPSASSDNYSIFLPRMVDDHYRTDKSEADDLTRITAQFNNITLS